MSTKREPIGVRCTPVRQSNGTYYVHMRRSDGSRPHSDGEYFANGRFTVQRKPDGDIVRASPVEDEAAAPEAARVSWIPGLTLEANEETPVPTQNVVWVVSLSARPEGAISAYDDGYEFWVVVKMSLNGAAEFDVSAEMGDQFLYASTGGDQGTGDYNISVDVPPPHSGVLVEMTAILYQDATELVEVDRATASFTTEPVT